ncbi:MAG: hypothetical protein R6V85_15245 [Polyangia bacterium]
MKWTGLLLGLALAVGGCTINAGDSDGGVDIAAGFSWTWSVVDYETDEPLNCDFVGAETARITVVDDNGDMWEIDWPCYYGEGETDSWDIATGPATVTAQLLDNPGDGNVLSETTFDFTFESGELSNDLGEVVFGVDTWEDPSQDADASIAWEWQFGPDEDSMEAPDQTMCQEAGIDYVNLWVWNPVYEQWWTDTAWTEFPCEAMDHDGDPWADAVWAGVWLEDFLAAGDYQLFLGFYQAAAYDEESSETTDVLLYYDERGTLDSPWTLEPDENLDPPCNDLGISLLDVDAQQFGVLKINLQWGQSQGGVFDSCYDSNVATMGFLLRNDGWVAAEVPLENGVECLDWLVFEEVPVLAGAYELLISGLSTDNEFLWYNLCTGLDPETDVAVDDATGYTCEIENQMAQ